MLGRRRRRWPNIEPTLGKHRVFVGVSEFSYNKHDKACGPLRLIDCQKPLQTTAIYVKKC